MPGTDGWTVLSTLAGGLGLFLLGMGMMTEGLRLAAGPALQQLLAQATRTRWHGLGAGFAVTALVQSSSAVTVATIGFINAGLLSLGGAVWVLFGANVGTTMTSWIVALVGLKFKVEVLAMPLVGVGVALSLLGKPGRWGATGTALAGFGLLFVGIGWMQQAFAGVAADVRLPQGQGVVDVGLQLLMGVGLTVLMQSSSASMTVALAAAQGGLISAQGAAAVVIGANVGTTVTAVLAALGATPGAKRAAAAHVVFNLLTAAVALAALPLLLAAVRALALALGLPQEPATELALFHTAFNLLGVALMGPLAGHLVRALERRFGRIPKDEDAPRFLDQTLLGVPALGVQALGQEVRRLVDGVAEALHRWAEGAAVQEVQQQVQRWQRLDAHVGAYVQGLQRTALAEATSAALADVLRQRRDALRALEAVAVGAQAPWPDFSADAQALQRWRRWQSALAAQLQHLRHAGQQPLGAALADAGWDDFARAHEDLKAHALHQVASGAWPPELADAWLQQAGHARDALQALTRLAGWQAPFSPTPSPADACRRNAYTALQPPL